VQGQGNTILPTHTPLGSFTFLYYSTMLTDDRPAVQYLMSVRRNVQKNITRQETKSNMSAAK